MREPFGRLDKGKTYIPAFGACVGRYKSTIYVRVAKLVRLQTDNLEIRGSESHPLHHRVRANLSSWLCQVVYLPTWRVMFMIELSKSKSEDKPAG